MKRIGVDLDGVVANFSGAFLKFANAMFQTEYVPEDQQDWDFSQFTPAQTDAVWDVIKGTHNFWQTLRPLEGTNRLRRATPRTHELVFITSRIPTLGRPVREQSSAWLREHFYITHPFVIVVDHPEQKMMLVHALGVEAFIDDKRSTIEEMNKTGARSYARLQPYNSATPFPEGVVPVETLDEYLEAEFGTRHKS